MVFERVNFNEEEVSKMTAEQFESRHIGIFWLDKDIEIRKKMLAQVYGMINKPSKRTKRSSNK